MQKQIESSLTSMEVAEMVDKKHYDLLKDIRRYTSQLGEGKISVSDFLQNQPIQQSRIKQLFATL